jgi:hypothetical protein
MTLQWLVIGRQFEGVCTRLHCAKWMLKDGDDEFEACASRDAIFSASIQRGDVCVRCRLLMLMTAVWRQNACTK